jgi:hypothetical protein
MECLSLSTGRHYLKYIISEKDTLVSLYNSFSYNEERNAGKEITERDRKREREREISLISSSAM